MNAQIKLCRPMNDGHIIVDGSTISQQLLDDHIYPFDRKPMSLEYVELAAELKTAGRRGKEPTSPVKSWKRTIGPSFIEIPMTSYQLQVIAFSLCFGPFSILVQTIWLKT
jgi:hypothetical protein